MRLSHKYNTGITLITVAMRSKAWTDFAHSNSTVVGSNHTRGMDVCVRLFCVYVVLCAGSGLATGWSPTRRVLSTVYRIKKLKNGQGPTKGCRTIDGWMDGRTDGRTDGWMDGWMDNTEIPVQIIKNYIYLSVCLFICLSVYGYTALAASATSLSQQQLATELQQSSN
jgi:hypothetical protein